MTTRVTRATRASGSPMLPGLPITPKVSRLHPQGLLYNDPSFSRSILPLKLSNIDDNKSLDFGSEDERDDRAKESTQVEVVVEEHETLELKSESSEHDDLEDLDNSGSHTFVNNDDFDADGFIDNGDDLPGGIDASTYNTQYTQSQTWKQGEAEGMDRDELLDRLADLNFYANKVKDSLLDGKKKPSEVYGELMTPDSARAKRLHRNFSGFKEAMEPYLGTGVLIRNDVMAIIFGCGIFNPIFWKANLVNFINQRFTNKDDNEVEWNESHSWETSFPTHFGMDGVEDEKTFKFALEWRTQLFIMKCSPLITKKGDTPLTYLNECFTTSYDDNVLVSAREVTADLLKGWNERNLSPQQQRQMFRRVQDLHELASKNGVDTDPVQGFNYDGLVDKYKKGKFLNLMSQWVEWRLNEIEKGLPSINDLLEQSKHSVDNADLQQFMITHGLDLSGQEIEAPVNTSHLQVAKADTNTRTPSNHRKRKPKPSFGKDDPDLMLLIQQSIQRKQARDQKADSSFQKASPNLRPRDDEPETEVDAQGLPSIISGGNTPIHGVLKLHTDPVASAKPLSRIEDEGPGTTSSSSPKHIKAHVVSNGTEQSPVKTLPKNPMKRLRSPGDDVSHDNGKRARLDHISKSPVAIPAPKSRAQAQSSITSSIPSEPEIRSTQIADGRLRLASDQRLNEDSNSQEMVANTAPHVSDDEDESDDGYFAEQQRKLHAEPNKENRPQTKTREMQPRKRFVDRQATAVRVAFDSQESQGSVLEVPNTVVKSSRKRGREDSMEALSSPLKGINGQPSRHASSAQNAQAFTSRAKRAKVSHRTRQPSNDDSDSEDDFQTQNIVNDANLMKKSRMTAPKSSSSSRRDRPNAQASRPPPRNELYTHREYVTNVEAGEGPSRNNFTSRNTVARITSSPQRQHSTPRSSLAPTSGQELARQTPRTQVSHYDDVDEDLQARINASTARESTPPPSNVCDLTQRDAAAHKRIPAVLQIRAAWTNEETTTLMELIAHGEGPPSFASLAGSYGVHNRSQVQLKDKARNIKYDYLRQGYDLPKNFEYVTISKSQIERLEKTYRIKYVQGQTRGIPTD